MIIKVILSAYGFRNIVEYSSDTTIETIISDQKLSYENNIYIDEVYLENIKKNYLILQVIQLVL